MNIQKIDRRTFVKATGRSVASGLFLSYSIPLAVRNPAAMAAEVNSLQPNVYLNINRDGVVEVICHRSEMGQGVRTSLPMIIAEELGADYDALKITQGLGDKKYGDQNTDGSTSIREFWQVLREAGATARVMLIQAAAKKTGLPESELETEKGYVVHRQSGKKFPFKDFVVAAAKLPVPKNPKLKSPAQFKIIGRSQKMHDLPRIIKGQAGFGIDAVRPNMIYASIERSPLKDGRVKSFKADKVLKERDVIQVVEIKPIGPDVNCNAGVAVVAKNTWAAEKARALLDIKWDFSGQKIKENTKDRQAAMQKALNGRLINHRNDGKKTATGKIINVGGPYRTPYLVHSPMEPLVCTAEVKKNFCEIWAPVQDPQRIQNAVAKYLQLQPEQVKINVTLLGGGFGRKSQPDFVLEAVQVAKAMNRPIKVQWSREDEIQHGFYHADSLQQIRVEVDEEQKLITSWRHNTTFPTIMTVFDESAKEAAAWEIGMGAQEFPYNVPHVQVNHAPIPTSVRIGWFRAVCHVWHGFAINSCLNEVAAHFNEDPIAFRLRQLGTDREVSLNPREKNGPYKQHTARLRKTIETLQQNISWKHKKGKNRGMGFAAYYSFYTYVATAIDASVENGSVKVHQIDIAIDPGTIVNPDTVRAQMEGAAIFGLSAALYGKITLNDGKVEQSNFHDYPLVRMNESPKINVFLVNSNELPTGVGEPGVPPIAPALTNAIFAATGKTVTSLPISDVKLS